MNLIELSQEFDKYCHPSWIEAISKKSFHGLKRDSYSELIKRIEIIKNFKDLYKNDIALIVANFENRKNYIEKKEKTDLEKRITVVLVVTLICYALITSLFEINVIINCFISLFSGSLAAGLIIGEKEIIPYEEQKSHEWLILKSHAYIDEILKLIQKDLKELDKKESKEYIQNMNPYEFEGLVANIFQHFGYSTRVTKGSGDKGIDINIEKDGHKEIIQCKRYKKRIGTPVIRDFIGTMNLSGIHNGYIVTTSDFSFEVVNLLKGKENDIKLIDIETLIVLYKAMNNGENPHFNDIVTGGMGEIVKSAASSEAKQIVAQLNYRGSYRYK